MFSDDRNRPAGAQAEAEMGATFQALSALADAQAAISAAQGEAHRTLEIVARAALVVAPNADGAAIELVEGDRLAYRAVSGIAEGHLGLSLAAAGSLSGLCVAQARALTADDCDTDPRVDHAACRLLNVRSMVVVPVFRHGRPVGVLKLQSARRSAFRQADVIMARLLVGALDVGFADAAESEADRARNASAVALAERFAELEALYAGAPIGLALLDRDLVYRRCNSRMAEINGVSVSAHVGRTLREILPALADPLEPLFRRVLQTGAAVRDVDIAGETSTAPGVVRHFLANYDPVVDASGVVVGVNVAVVDTTEARQAQATLAASEAQFRTAADALPGLLFVTSANGHNVYVNEGYRALTGRTDDELLGDRWVEALHPVDAVRSKAVWDEAVRSASVYETEHRVRRRDGAWRWHVVRALPVRRDDGLVERWVGCCVDIHERRMSEEELQRRIADALSERRLWAEIVEASDAYIQVLDPDLRVLAINRANAEELERVYGVRPRPGLAFEEILHGRPQALEELTSLWRRALAGERHTHIGEYGDEECGRRWYEMKFSPLYGSDARLMGALSISYDVTERLREQRALAARTEELRRANARLTAEIKRREEAQAALAQAQKLEALGQLTSGIAHDFNNVTQAVAGGFALIQSRASDPKIAEIARHGAAAAQRGGQLVKQLLAFARRQTLKPLRVELAKQLVETAPLIERTLGAGVTLSVECAPEIPAVLVDPALLETALINLAANARDAMPEGGSLVIRARESLSGEPHRPAELEPCPAVAIEVSDTGKGIGPAVLQRVLEPFFTTKGHGQGTGLGLAMVHGFVKQSNGALRIESHEGRGTMVTLYFPRADTQEEALQVEELPSAAAELEEPTTVLLVDDDAAVRTVTAAQLEGLGRRVIQAANAQAAVAAFDLAIIDLVVSDVMMPGDDGPALAETLRRRRPNLPILFVTGYADRDRLAGECVLEKPFTSQALAEAMGRAMTAAGQLATVDDVSLDRLASRLKTDSLRDLFSKWRAARRSAPLPRFDARDFETNCEPGKLIVVEVDSAHMPLRFHMAKVGGELEAALGRKLTGADLAVTGADDLGSLEAAYRRCVRTVRPVYDYARLALDDAAPDTFERLLTPWSTDGRTIDRLVGIAIFRGPAFGADKQEGIAS